MEEAVKKIAPRAHFLAAAELAAEAGSILAANMVMTGALAGSGLLPFGREFFQTTIEALFKGSIRELNVKAFESGFSQLSPGI
ncbi:MAG: 2-oxoacid:acceptor oxidoreductase family protein [Dethiobacter sp.]|nr:2-oxoacid:acceptor oxidoreductase family protein [Dethiobacter sp.]